MIGAGKTPSRIKKRKSKQVFGNPVGSAIKYTPFKSNHRWRRH